MREENEHTIYIGFAFSLDKDGSFGDYNRDIARSLMDSWKAETKDRGSIWIGVQWELYDALVCQDAKFVDSHLPLTHVAAPPLFSEEDLEAEDCVGGFRRMFDVKNRPLLESATTGILREELEAELERTPPEPVPGAPTGIARIRHPDQLASLLNCIILEGEFLKRLIVAAHRVPDGEVTFDAEKRDGWKEDRRLPKTADGLGPFQSRRMTRIVLDWLLERNIERYRIAGYLNTVQVCKTLFDRAELEGVKTNHVKVFGFPEHSPRCTAAVLQALWLRGQRARVEMVPKNGVISVTDVNNPAGTVDRVTQNPTSLGRAGGLSDFSWRWYAPTSQEWCRSLIAWKRHEGRG